MLSCSLLKFNQRLQMICRNSSEAISIERRCGKKSQFCSDSLFSYNKKMLFLKAFVYRKNEKLLEWCDLQAIMLDLL